MCATRAEERAGRCFSFFTGLFFAASLWRLGLQVQYLEEQNVLDEGAELFRGCNTVSQRDARSRDVNKRL